MKDVEAFTTTLRAALVADGWVLANTDGPPDGPVEILFGSATAELIPCPPTVLRGLDMARPSRLEALNPQADAVSLPGAPKGISIKIDQREDWRLPDSRTFQIQVHDHSTPCRVEVGAPIQIDAGRQGMLLHACLAAHRAQAVLHVDVLHLATGRRVAQKIGFDPKYPGGRQRDEYQQVALALPTDLRGAVEVHLTVEYQCFVDDGSHFDPFLFLADVRVDESRPGDLALPRPHMVLGQTLPADGVWMAARLPVLPAPGAVAQIRIGSDCHDIDLPQLPAVTVADAQMPILTVRSPAATPGLLYVDGKPALAVSLLAGETRIRLPDTYMDGASHRLSLRDRSGTLACWEGHVLLPAILTPADTMQRDGAAPFPSAIFPQTARRLGALRALLATAGPQTDFAQLTHAFDTVEGGHDRVQLLPLRFPQVADPDVSIVIPAHNKVEVTYLALCSLLIASNRASFEVIVVDDASTDATATLETLVEGITVLHNSAPQRFIRACNAGAAQARGRYIALLNNDVEVTAGWLDELIAAFGRFDRVGIAGAKLLYPDGRLQDAGGIVWGTGNPWNYGNRQNADDLRFCYARQADYLSGAALMVPREVWEKVGGLSSYLEPMYFEDTDLAFKVRAAGYTTWFVPSAVVYHHEGLTSGSDVTQGMKRFQEVNRPKFKRRWADAFARFGNEAQAPDLEKDRGIVGRVLFIDYATPRPDQDAGSYAALQEIRLVQSLGYKVTFLSLNMAHLGNYTSDLQRRGVEMIYAPFYLSAQEYLARHAAEFDAFYITRYHVARDVLGQLRRLAPAAKVLFNNADLHFLREMRAAHATRNPDRLADALRTRDEELAVINQVDVVLSYNDAEHAVIEASYDGRARIMRTPWVVDLPASVPPLAGRRGLTFLGSFRHTPNLEGLAWFASEILPRLTGQDEDLTLSVYGARMNNEVRALAGDRLKPVGFVPDVAQAFDPHRIFVAPLLSGAGIKGKVIEALSRGMPAVLSPVAAEGIGLRHGLDCLIARTPEDWIEAIGRLTADDALCERMAAAARDHIRDSYSFAQGRIAMREAFEAADLFRSSPGVR